MPLRAKTTVVGSLFPSEAWEIVSCLTRTGSEFQQEVERRDTSTPVSLVLDETGTVIAWAATHEWRGQQTLEGFTRPGFRQRGLMRLAAAMLVADGLLDTSRPVAVFSPACVSIATAVGLRRVRLYERRGEDWIENS